MTRSFIQGYSVNLYIFVDLIIFGILFSQCEEIILDYYVPRYKCTYMFKTLCNWAIPWDPHFKN